jgi:hypothetical protein
LVWGWGLWLGKLKAKLSNTWYGVVFRQESLRRKGAKERRIQSQSHASIISSNRRDRNRAWACCTGRRRYSTCQTYNLNFSGYIQDQDF